MSLPAVVRKRIAIVEADITTLDVDAIVNAANSSLLGGGGVGIAFPGISTGIYRYPQREAADTAIVTVAAELEGHELPSQVILCTYDSLATFIMTEALAALV